MSRIGKMPIAVPKGVTVEIAGSAVTVKGGKGSLTRRFDPDMAITLDGGVLHVQRPTDAQRHRALHGLTRALLQNMVVGVSQGFTRKLVVEGVGYRAEMAGNNLVLNVGYSHPVQIAPPTAETRFAVEGRAGRDIVVTGIDKQIVGEVCAQIRRVRPPEPYKGKGIRYEGEVVRRKAGKTGKV